MDKEAGYFITARFRKAHVACEDSFNKPHRWCTMKAKSNSGDELPLNLAKQTALFMSRK